MPCSRQTVFGFRWLTTFSSQNAACWFDIGFGAARGEELGGLHGGDLLGNCRRHELIDARSIFFADFCDGRFQRRRQPQRVGYSAVLHDVIFLRYFIDIIFDVAGAAEGCIRPVFPELKNQSNRLYL